LNKEDIISSGLLELYALGLASPEEQLQVEEGLKLYPEVRQELEAIELSLESYAQTHAVEPSAEVKNKILGQITTVETSNNHTEEKPKVHHILGEDSKLLHQNIYRIPPFFKIAAAAVLIALIYSVILNYSYDIKYQNVKEELTDAQKKLKENQQAAVAMKDQLNVISDKSALPIVLKGTTKEPDALAKIYWVKNSGDVYVDPTNLPEVPAGKQYQLWAIVDGKPVDAGMITTKKGIYHIQKMKSFGHAEAFAITLEKEGGSPTPTMDQMYVISKI
jgi:anti-sigma-K factor RskA